MDVSIAELVEYWRRGAEEDIDTAGLLLAHSKLRECLFFVHLSLEKSLKARVVTNTRTYAPKTHNLIALADLAAVALSEVQRLSLFRYNRYCMVGRYPDYASVGITREEAHLRRAEGERLLQWLLQN